MLRPQMHYFIAIVARLELYSPLAKIPKNSPKLWWNSGFFFSQSIQLGQFLSKLLHEVVLLFQERNYGIADYLIKTRQVAMTVI